MVRAQMAPVPSWRGHIHRWHRLHLGVPSLSPQKAVFAEEPPQGPSRLRSQREKNSRKKARKDSRQALPCFLGLVDVTLVQGALVASCLTQRLVELKLDDEADKVPGGERGTGWGWVARGLCHRAWASPAPPPPTAARMSE